MTNHYINPHWWRKFKLAERNMLAGFKGGRKVKHRRFMHWCKRTNRLLDFVIPEMKGQKHEE